MLPDDELPCRPFSSCTKAGPWRSSAASNAGAPCRGERGTARSTHRRDFAQVRERGRAYPARAFRGVLTRAPGTVVAVMRVSDESPSQRWRSRRHGRIMSNRRECLSMQYVRLTWALLTFTACSTTLDGEPGGDGGVDGSVDAASLEGGAEDAGDASLKADAADATLDAYLSDAASDGGAGEAAPVW